MRIQLPPVLRSSADLSSPNRRDRSLGRVVLIPFLMGCGAPLLIACGASRNASDENPVGNDMPVEMQPDLPEPEPGSTDIPEPGSSSEGVDDDLVLAPVDEPDPEPVLPEPTPAVCSVPMAPLAAFDCGSEGIVFENSGPSQNRVNYVILGDGYTADMLDTTYREHIQNMLTERPTSMFSQLGEPYLRYRKFINVCALKVASNDACIDDQDTGLQCDTVFSTSGDDDSRLVRFPQASFGIAEDIFADLLPDAVDVDWVGVTVNAGANNWWNSGGRFMIWNGSYVNGGNQPRNNSASVALHEGGHAFHGLADEYDGDGCGRNATHPNVTTDPSGARWQVWLGFNHDPENPDATGAVGTGVQGTFEGALYCDTGYYRPSDDSQMNLLPEPFNMPSIDKIIRDIYEIVDPIDALTDTAIPLVNPTEIRVRVVDPAILKVDWSVDGAPAAGASGECFDATGLAPGEHTVSAHVYDDTPWVRSDRSELEQTVSWTVRVQAAPAPQ